MQSSQKKEYGPKKIKQSVYNYFHKRKNKAQKNIK